METTNEHPWLIALSAPLDDEKLSSAVKENNEDWEYLDAQVIKLGTISHQQVDIKEVQQRAVMLLENETKDMRVVTHLLRTLQHKGDSNDLLLALVLFHRYVDLFWETAYPNERLKVRLATQILKRFSAHAEVLGKNSTAPNREIILSCLTKLAERLAAFPALEEELTFIRQKVIYAAETPTEMPSNAAQTQSAGSSSSENPTAASPALAMPHVDINIDNSNERAWKNTLIKVSELLFEQHPDREISYRLRRTAIWLTVDGVLLADENGVTQLGIPISQDRLSDYLSAIPNATPALLKQVETSLTISPYWFEGHYISAQIAAKLGFQTVAEAIREEVAQLLTRIPALLRFRFSDQTWFVNEHVQKWIAASSPSQSHASAGNNDTIWQCYEENGLEAALNALEDQPPQETRSYYYQQALAAALLEQAGLEKLARQQREQIKNSAKHLTVSEWEPSFFASLSKKKHE